MNTKTTLAIIASLTVLAAAITPTLMTQADAKITERTQCERPSGNVREGPCPGASGTQGQSEEETQRVNPQGKAPPGQN